MIHFKSSFFFTVFHTGLGHIRYVLFPGGPLSEGPPFFFLFPSREEGQDLNLLQLGVRVARGGTGSVRRAGLSEQRGQLSICYFISEGM